MTKTIKTKEIDANGNIYDKVVFAKMTDGLWVELDVLNTSEPYRPLQIYIADDLVYDSVAQFYRV